MQTCLVGGAVRDALLGLPVQERDWVVVGATPEQRVAQGFLPVGKDFPVTCTPVAYFSDRGRLFQRDRGRRFSAIVDEQGCAQAKV